MSVTITERTPDLSPAPEAPLDAMEVYEQVLEYAQPLHEDAEWRSIFYGHMGVRPTQWQSDGSHPSGHLLYDAFEGRQPGGSFKLRGGTSAVMHAVARAQENDEAFNTFHIASKGNAALATAHAAGKYGLKTVAHVTKDASRTKVDALILAGVDVVSDYDDMATARTGALSHRRPEGHLVAHNERALTIEPFDQLTVIAGQFTLGLEKVKHLLALERAGQVDLHKTKITDYEPVGGGSLLSGVSAAFYWAKQKGYMGDNVRVMGVQMEGCDAARRSLPYLRRGLPLPADLFATGVPFNGATDGAAVHRAGEKTMSIIADQRFVSGIETVTEAEVGEAMLHASNLHNKNIEPTAALALAGARKHASTRPLHVGRQPELHLTTTSGVNVDSNLFEYFKAAALRRREEHSRLRNKADEHAAELKAYRARLRFANERQTSVMPVPPASDTNKTISTSTLAAYHHSISGPMKGWSSSTAAFRDPKPRA